MEKASLWRWILVFRSCGLRNVISADCPKLPVPRNVTMVGKILKFGSKVTFKCAKGYSIVSGNILRECLRGGRWSGKNPVCRGKHLLSNDTERPDSIHPKPRLMHMPHCHQSGCFDANWDLIEIYTDYSASESTLSIDNIMWYMYFYRLCSILLDRIHIIVIEQLLKHFTCFSKNGSTSERGPTFNAILIHLIYSHTLPAVSK
jgi:hypothetical protein